MQFTKSEYIYLVLLTFFLFLFFYSCSTRETPTENTGNNEPLVKQTWEERANLGKGSISALILDSGNNIFIATDTSGVFKSTNDGKSWEFFNNGLLDKHITCLAFDSAGSVLAGTLDSGIFQSPVLGDQWFQSDSSNKTIWSLITLRNGSILAGTSSGLLKSYDNGESWSLVSIPSLQHPFSTFNFNSSDKIYGGTIGQGILFSDNLGLNWQNTNLNGLSVLTLSVNIQGDIFAGTLSSGALRSSDNGNSWEKMENGFPADYVTDIAINSLQEIYIGTYGYGIYRSSDNGDTWKSFNDGLKDFIVTSLAFDSGDYLLASTSSGQIYRTTQSTRIDVVK
ncbi:MAG: sialidase family protein [Calditrichota bacterium]